MTYPQVNLHIDGAWVKGAGGKSEPVLNPATGDPIGDVPHADKADLDRAGWKSNPLTDGQLDSFRVTPIELGSPPTSVGTVPGSQRAFVGQDHPDGRISFIDYQTNSVQTVTGFELNSRIRQ